MKPNQTVFQKSEGSFFDKGSIDAKKVLTFEKRSMENLSKKKKRKEKTLRFFIRRVLTNFDDIWPHV